MYPSVTNSERILRPFMFLPGSRAISTRIISKTGGICAFRSLSHVADRSRSTDLPTQVAWLFLDSVFPIRLSSFDFRHYIGVFRQDSLLSRISELLSSVNSHNFEVISLEPHLKDGGVFVKFKYFAPNEATDVLESIQNDVREQVIKHGGLPNWMGVDRGDVWLVRGSPWREDMNRFASPTIKFTFDGPDVQEELLYEILRPYGRIQDLTLPTPLPAGIPRYSTVNFRQIRSAVIARNVVHGLAVPANNSTQTKLRAAYLLPIQAHVVRDWITSHPRIVLPVIVFLLGTLTYTIFDPIRSVMIEGKLEGWFDYRKFAFYKWLRASTVDRISLVRSTGTGTGKIDHESLQTHAEIWKERKEAEVSLNNYLSDLPTTIAFIHGPQGSGKSRMTSVVVHESERNALIIDCAELHKAPSDARLVAALAQQVGYWPIFTFLNSMNSLIDLASVGLIGQKAGMSSSLADQLKQILEVTRTGLKRVSGAHRAATQRRVKDENTRREQQAKAVQLMERIKLGAWHDGRLDCVAGNGVMSELGVGDEQLTENDFDVLEPSMTQASRGEGLKENEERTRRERNAKEGQAVNSLPIVIIKNFATKGGKSKEELLEVLAEWAASLAENQVAHVIVMSDNRENAKRLAKALPAKPLNNIALYDADAASALSFVKQKLQDTGVDLDYTPEQVAQVQRLGGRASDLESLIHKVRSGQNVEEAVEDIISRGVGELRKNAFGDDMEDSENLTWSREQAWAVMKQLASREEIPYYDVLLNFPFKGDETALRSMEHSELIAISTHNGRPSTIRPGKPVFKYVFERLVSDPIFQATQDIAFNEKIISSSESAIKACEAELATIKEIISGTGYGSSWLGRTATSARTKYLLDKMLKAEEKIESLERNNQALRKLLTKST